MSKYTREEILNQLDECAGQFVFPMLDNGYAYLADVRLSAYRDEGRWALILEVLSCNNRAFEHGVFMNILHCFGNCLQRPPGTANEDIIGPISDSPNEPIFVEENDLTFVRPDLTELRIHDQIVPVDLTSETLSAKGIELESPPMIHDYELLRFLLPENRDLLLATEAELQQRVPADLPLLLTLDEWHHPDLCSGELPSESATFQMLADVLVTGDTNFYTPVIPPNTHWTNWPDGGTL